MTGTYIVGVNYGNKMEDETSIRVILVNGDQTMFVNEYRGKRADKVLETLVTGNTSKNRKRSYDSEIDRLKERVDYLKSRLNNERI